MNRKQTNKTVWAKPTKSLLFLGTLLLGFIGCKKESRTDVITTKSPQQITAMSVLKAHATAQEFNDLDWNNVQVSYLNGTASLLRIKSKTDTSKVLLYSKKNGVIHARWVQFKSNSGPGAGVVVVSSLNESHLKISSFRNGRIYASRRVISSSFIASNNPTSSAKSSSNSSSATLPASGQRNLKEAPVETVDPGDDDGDDDDGSFDGGDDDGGGGGGGGGGAGDGGSVGGDDGGSVGGDDGSTGTYGDDGGDDGDGDIAYSITLQEVTITATPIDSPTIYLYSLYELLGDNPDYINEYTTNPTTPFKGTVITLTPGGSANGIDPNFKPGQKSGTPIIKYQPSSLLMGQAVSIGYNITTVNGVTTINVSNITAAIVGNSIGVGWTTLSTNTTISGSVIDFSVSGTVNFGITVNGVGPTFYSRPCQLTGTYNTSNGAYTITVTND